MGEAGNLAFPAGHPPSNLPAGSSLGLAQPLLLVLILKCLLLAKYSQIECSGLTTHAIKMHMSFLKMAKLKVVVKSSALKARLPEFESPLCSLQ